MNSMLLVLWLLMAIIGHLVGKEKGYPVWGFFMGLILGLIGIIILLFVKPKVR